MSFLALKFYFPIVFVHMFTPFSIKVKQNKQKEAPSAGLGLEL